MQLLLRRRPSSLGQHLGRALLSSVALTAGCALLAAGGGGERAQIRSMPDDGLGTIQVEQVADPAIRLMQEFDCSTVGYGDGSTPRGAIVRRPTGKLDVVSFDEGWEVYVAEGSAQLVAVCLKPPA